MNTAEVSERNGSRNVLSYDELLEEQQNLLKELDEARARERQLTIELARKNFNQNSLERRLENNSRLLIERNSKFKILKNDLEDFYYAASHHLKSPLRNIAGFVQLIEKKFEGKLDAQGSEYMKFVTENTNYLNNLIEDLLYYTMLNSHGEKVQLVALEEVVQQIAEEFNAMFGKENATLEFGELPVIKAYPFLIHLLFRELVENALKFRSKRAPMIKVSCKYKEGDYIISVSDNGIGIKEKYADKVFSLFSQLHESGKYQGTGMGLALCQKIVELHKGKIWFTSKRGHGTIFSFSLPVEFEIKSK